jgi:hypothetical protein
MLPPWISDALDDVRKGDVVAHWASRARSLAANVPAIDATVVLNALAVCATAFCCFLLVLFSLKPFKKRKFPRLGDDLVFAGGNAEKQLTVEGRNREVNGCVRKKIGCGGAGKRVLVVTAHPDDECMFFGPTIVELLESGALVYILCFSTGLNDT